jgi:anti-sigma factor RsiW
MLWMLSRSSRQRRCHETRALMSEYLDSELDQSHAAAVESHLRWCRSCRRVLANLRRTVDALGRLGDSEPPPEGHSS